ENDVRYVWLSTPKQSGGISSGSPIHFVRPLTESFSASKPFLVTEGALKAATVQNHYPEFNVIAIGGISSSHSELIKAVRRFPLITAFDNDFLNNPQVLRQLVRFLRARFSDASNHNYNSNLFVLSWCSDFNGIDEAIINNRKIEIVSFSQWISELDLSLKSEFTQLMCYNSN
nr:hypothetical protein [Pyrinomonadaceae bacterium]